MDDRSLQQADLATGMTLGERIREGFRLFEQGSDYIVRSIQEAFPEATPDDVQRIRDIVLRRAGIWVITYTLRHRAVNSNAVVFSIVQECTDANAHRDELDSAPIP